MYFANNHYLGLDSKRVIEAVAEVKKNLGEKFGWKEVKDGL